MCDCKEQLETKMRERIPQVVPEATDIDVQLGGYVYTIGKAVGYKPALKFEGSYMVPKKSGGLKKQKVHDMMVASFCPFCGVSLAEPKSERDEGF